jgi:RNA polymerase sigma-70 factor (ECF subfamily)
MTDGSTSAAPLDEQDARIRNLVESGDLEASATLFMETYGGEILSFLLVRMRSEPAASEVFSVFAEDFWRGLPGFRWRTTIRSWGYTLARNAAHRHHRTRRIDCRPLTRPSRMLEAVERQRSSTAAYLRTEVKSRMRELRRQLPEDDQTLLVLRIDKGLSWNELAGVFSGKGEDMPDDDRVRWAARLRQRFVAVKGRLRDLAEAEGLI